MIFDRLLSVGMGARRGHLGEPGQLGWVPVRGDSMWPSLKEGDEAGFARGGRTPRPGEVVLARVGPSYVVHRVVSLEGEGAAAVVSLRGDNSLGVDPPVPLGAVVGVVERVRRKGRELSKWDRGPRRVGVLRARVRAAARRWLLRLRRGKGRSS